MVITSVADAFVVMRGGIGTLTEMMLVWSSAAVGEMKKPIVLLGRAWQETIGDLSKQLLIRDSDTKLLRFAEIPQEALEILNEFRFDK